MFLEKNMCLRIRIKLKDNTITFVKTIDLQGTLWLLTHIFMLLEVFLCFFPHSAAVIDLINN